MAVVIETTLGDITVDLFIEERPHTCKNFLKLCKIKYYNFNLFHSVQSNFLAQTGDPTGTGNGGDSIFGLIMGSKNRYFQGEKTPKIKHNRPGLLSMVNCGDFMLGSQFFITLGTELSSLDDHCVFAEVTEGQSVLLKLNETICDSQYKPYQDVRITHTVILEDPFEDLPGMIIPSASPDISQMIASGRIAADESIVENDKTEEELAELRAEKEAKARATILEIVGDLPEADAAPPENVLFVCKLNPVTNDEDLELIFRRFGNIKSCEVIRDKVTGDSLQYAFIEFEDKKSCELAYEKMENTLIDDRRIHVDFSQSVAKLRWKGKGRGVEHINANEEFSKNYGSRRKTGEADRRLDDRRGDDKRYDDRRSCKNDGYFDFNSRKTDYKRKSRSRERSREKKYPEPSKRGDENSRKRKETRKDKEETNHPDKRSLKNESRADRDYERKYDRDKDREDKYNYKSRSNSDRNTNDRRRDERKVRASDDRSRAEDYNYRRDGSSSHYSSDVKRKRDEKPDRSSSHVDKRVDLPNSYDTNYVKAVNNEKLVDNHRSRDSKSKISEKEEKYKSTEKEKYRSLDREDKYKSVEKEKYKPVEKEIKYKLLEKDDRRGYSRSVVNLPEENGRKSKDMNVSKFVHEEKVVFMETCEKERDEINNFIVNEPVVPSESNHVLSPYSNHSQTSSSKHKIVEKLETNSKKSHKKVKLSSSSSSGSSSDSSSSNSDSNSSSSSSVDMTVAKKYYDHKGKLVRKVITKKQKNKSDKRKSKRKNDKVIVIKKKIKKRHSSSDDDSGSSSDDSSEEKHKRHRKSKSSKRKNRKKYTESDSDSSDSTSDSKHKKKKLKKKTKRDSSSD